MIRWLHISDIHLGSEGMTTSMLRDELPVFLKKEGLKCDYVFCTGDIKTAGRGDCGFSNEMADYICKICDAVEVDTQMLFIVPGNHDINREITERKSAIEKVMFRRNGYYNPDTGEISAGDMADIMKGETDFKNFLAKIYNADRAAMYGNPDRPHFNIETPHFNILHVDTTLVYSEGQEAYDLIVGTDALYKEVQKLNIEKPVILLTHYPITSLLQDERRLLSDMLQKHQIRLWLAGHEHDHVVQRIQYIDQMQAGELRREDKANATFLIGEYDESSGNGRVIAYTWFREGWCQYPILDLDNERKECYEFRLRTVGKDDLSLLSSAAKKANSQYYNRLPDKVEQSLLPAIDDNGRASSLETLLSETWDTATPHLIILADGGMGKTTMLLNYCKNTSTPVLYIPAERLVTLGLGIEQYCISTLYGNDENKFRNSLCTRYSKPTLTLFIDGLNEVDGKDEKAFVLELQRMSILKGLRIVVTSRSNFTLRYSMPGYRRTSLKELEDSLVCGYFDEKEWSGIKESRALHRLLANPMMVTVYKEICSVIDEFRNVEFLDWRLPVKNSTDLLHNYYVAQMALMLKRGCSDGQRMLIAMMCIRVILPAIAYEYECRRRMNASLGEFRELLDAILQNIVIDPQELLPIQEHFREDTIPSLDIVKVIDFLTQNSRLMHRDMAVTAFPHQIYRDYLSAQWIIRQSHSETNILGLWNTRQIPHPVMIHIRCGSGAYWNDGIACKIHNAGIGLPADSSSFLVDNIFKCFPQTDQSGIPDFSRLCLKGHRLPDNPLGNSKINLEGAEIDERTVGLSSDDEIQYTNLCLSYERDMVAAVATTKNGRKSLNIFSIDKGLMIFHHELNCSVLNMVFHGHRLFVAAGGIFIFVQNEDGQWHYSGGIGDNDKNVLKRLQTIMISDDRLFLYFYDRLEKYDLSDISLKSVEHGIECDKIVDGELVELLTRPVVPININQPRQWDVISEAGDDALKVKSFADGGLIVESEGETQLILSRGTTLLLDAAISGDGKIATTLGFHSREKKRKIQLWNLDNEERLADLTCPSIINNLHLSETGKWLMGETENQTWVLNRLNGKEKWYDEHFVSNHTGRLVSYGDKVIRKKDGLLYMFNLQDGRENLLETPVPNPKMVCFLPNGTLAAVDETGKTLHLWSTRDGKRLSQYMDGYNILSIQPIQNNPFIAIFTSDNNIRIYHTGVRRNYGANQMQCLIKKAGATNARQIVAHPSISLIAATDSHRYIETRFFREWKSDGHKRGLWERHPFLDRLHHIDGDILDISFNQRNNRLVVILANGRIMYCDSINCTYLDSLKIITSFNVNAYDFTNCICSENVTDALRRNGAR